MEKPPSRRYLPHFPTSRGSVFLTWRLHRIQPALRPEERDLVVDVIGRGEGVIGGIVAGVVMDDHVHVLVTLRSDTTVQRVIHVWKSASAHRLVKEHGRISPVWQRDYFDRSMVHGTRMSRCIRYILDNPKRRWPDLHAYDWVFGRCAP